MKKKLLNFFDKIGSKTPRDELFKKKIEKGCINM